VVQTARTGVREDAPVHLTFRDAGPDDAAAVVAMVRRAYRGDDSRAGWTTEADLIADDRVDEPTVLDRVRGPGSVVRLALDADGLPVACCELLDRSGGLAYFGMFAVRPDLQAAGLGRQVLAEAERLAAGWGCTAVEMTVIAQRAELIAWYVRRGYALTGEQRRFPYGHLLNGRALRDDLYFVVLRKELGAG
jgi:GNAT superfamily N-acetyltransferase